MRWTELNTHPRGGPVFQHRTPTTSVLTATTLIYAIGAGITAAAGTRLALQLILVKAIALNSFQLQDMNALYCYFSSLPHCFRIGQFARLLPSLDAVAISQAPSPESNPFLGVRRVQHGRGNRRCRWLHAQWGLCPHSMHTPSVEQGLL